MLSLRSLAPCRHGLAVPAKVFSSTLPGCRTNATLATPKPDAPASSVPPASSTTASPGSTSHSDEVGSQGRRKRREPTTRPKISVEEPRKWNRPLGEGILPAYDLALNFLRADSLRLKAEAKELKRQVTEQEKEVEELRQKIAASSQESEGPEAQLYAQKDAELERLRERLNILEVQSEINLPEVRWRVANAMVLMDKPVHRHLVEQKWRKEGDLDLLMERIHQMHVVPDVLPVLHPSIDLRVTAKHTSKQYWDTKKVESSVEPGSFLLPEQTLVPPKLYADVFHTDTRLYTLLMVDPDVPNEESASFSTYLHWMRPNIPLSASHRGRILDLDDHTKYIPPHPQRGTPYHRYVILLLPQPPASGQAYSLNTAARAKAGESTSKYLDIPVIPDSERTNFDVRAFIKEWGLNPAKGGGAHMFREVWNERVSKIYEDVLQTPEPRYGRPRKHNPYAELKDIKRYV
ncbi:hypothetical protein AX16_000539 [Volvariella volvacea WC 439]|nr:hypothetical protein AX16_000539 [Volvariella volvacea WC 439]